MNVDDLSFQSKTVCSDHFPPPTALVTLCLPVVFFLQDTRNGNQMQTPPPINTCLQLLQMIFLPSLLELRGCSFSSLNFSKSCENIQLCDAEILNLGANCDYLSD